MPTKDHLEAPEPPGPSEGEVHPSALDHLDAADRRAAQVVVTDALSAPSAAGIGCPIGAGTSV